MIISIMQPYFMPYLGYFQLMNSSDIFVIYDNIQFTKKGWFNRNRILLDGKEILFTIPVKKDSDYLDVMKREIAENFKKIRLKILRQITMGYSKAPYYASTMPIVEKCFNSDTQNLFDFILNSIMILIDYFEVETKILKSSSIPINHDLKGQAKVIALCDHLQAKTYVNPVGGQSLYSKSQFQKHGIQLKFLSPNKIRYKQFSDQFIPNLSIIDVMMFNSRSQTKILLKDFTLI